MSALEIKALWMAGPDTFICSINGQITIDELAQIENDLCDNDMEWAYPEGTELTLRCVWDEPWDEYGTGYGDILHWPGSWDFTVVSSSTPAEGKGDTK